MLADYLAKCGTKEEESKDIIIPIQDFKASFKEDEWEDTQEIIIKESKHKSTFYFTNYYKRNRKKCWFNINVSRTWDILVNRLIVRANHYNLKTSLVRKGYISSPDCECGLGIEDGHHVVWKCTNLFHQRTELLKRIKDYENKSPEPLMKIIQREDW